MRLKKCVNIVVLVLPTKKLKLKKKSCLFTDALTSLLILLKSMLSNAFKPNVLRFGLALPVKKKSIGLLVLETLKAHNVQLNTLIHVLKKFDDWLILNPPIPNYLLA